MGKRKKAARKPGAGKAKSQPLDKSFRCLFCSHPGTIICKLDRSNFVGKLGCTNCNVSFANKIHHLTEPIDLYSDWIDACQEVNPEASASTSSAARRPIASNSRSDASDSRRRADDDDEEGASGRGRGGGAYDDEDDDEEEEARPEKRRATVKGVVGTGGQGGTSAGSGRIGAVDDYGDDLPDVADL